MKKFTILIVALLVVAMGFAIGKRQIDRRGASLSVGKQVVTNASKASLGNLKKCGALSTENGIGINNAGTLSGAVLFTSDELTANVGQFINKMQIGFANPSVITSGKIKILTGTPSAFVTKYEQNINVFEEGINEYELDFPYQIPANTNVALAYEIVVTGDLPMGVDEGPAVENGDLISINGGAWQSLSASDMDYNLIISASTTTEVDNYIILAPNTTYFYTSVGEEAEAKEVELNGYLTEGNITVSLENESAFEICLTEDGTYASSVQVAAANLPATIFVKYNTQATNSLDDETLTATVGELTSTVTLEGRTFDCSTVQTLPYSEDFNEVISPCWTIVDVNEDGYTWEYDASRGGMIVYSYDYDEENDVEIAIDADEYLISTAFEIPEGGAYFTFDTKSAIADYPEAYNVFVATDPENEEAYTEVLPATTTTADWFTNLINIPSSFNGQDVHIIFHMAGRDHYAMILDNFEIMANPTEINVEITDVYTSVDGTVPAGVDFSLGAKIKNLGVAINSFKASYTLNEEAPVVKTFSELEIAFNENYAFNFDAFSLTEGEAEIVVTISEVNGDAEFTPISETITITATTCATIAELPYSENFDNGIPTCWFASDNNLDANSWTDLASTLNAVAGNPEDIAEAMGDVEYYTNDSSANCLVTWSQYPESVEIVDFLPPYGIYFPEVVNAEYENDEYLYTPVITIPQDGAFVKFFQSYFPENASADSIKFYACNTGSLDIEDYTLLYSGKPTNTMTAIETTIPTNMWNSDVRFAFHVFGEEGNVLIDDFTVEALPTDIIAEVEITSPANEANVFVGEELIITADVINGGTMISELTLAFEIDGVEIDRDTVREANIYYGEAQNYIFDPYTEITAGEHTIVVTLSNVNEDDTFEAVTDTIIVNAIECTPVTEFPYIEDFENDLDPCWQVINANNDNKTWSVSDGVLTYGYNTSNAADDYVITKAINFTEAGTYFVRFDYRARSATLPENLAFLSGANADVETMTTIEAFENLTTATYTTYTYNLVITEPTTKYFAFKAYSIADRFGIYIDNFNIIAAPTTAEIALTSVAPATATTIREDAQLTISGVVTNNGTDLTGYTVAYKVDDAEPVSQTISDINVAFGATHAFTFAPATLAVGEHTIVVTVSNPNGTADNADDNSKTITVTVTPMPTCDPITEFPYVEDFETENAVECWTFIDADGDGYNWYHSYQGTGATGYNGSASLLQSESYVNETYEALTPDNWAITPALVLPAGTTPSLEFYMGGQDPEVAEEHYGVYVSTTTTETSAFTLLFEETMNAQGGAKAQGVFGHKVISLNDYAGQTIYIAFRHFDCTDMFILNLDQITVSLTMDVEENIASAVSVYPNPANNVVTIANAEGQNVVVINSLGQVVASVENASANHTIDLSNFANGTYFVKVGAEVVKLNVVK